VTLSGGSGRASVSSPAKLVVSGGAMTATIEWSSNSFDKMVVNDVEYAPTNTEGNSTFDIPVSALDTDIAVSAETTAMSQPHMVDYTLHFDSKTVQAK
jgi:iron complex transport system substrate-binding protein